MRVTADRYLPVRIQIPRTTASTLSIMDDKLVYTKDQLAETLRCIDDAYQHTGGVRQVRVTYGRRLPSSVLPCASRPGAGHDAT